MEWIDWMGFELGSIRLWVLHAIHYTTEPHRRWKHNFIYLTSHVTLMCMKDCVHGGTNPWPLDHDAGYTWSALNTAWEVHGWFSMFDLLAINLFLYYMNFSKQRIGMWMLSTWQKFPSSKLEVVSSNQQGLYLLISIIFGYITWKYQQLNYGMFWWSHFGLNG